MGGGWRLWFNGYRVFVRGNEKVLEIAVMVAIVNAINTTELYT